MPNAYPELIIPGQWTVKPGKPAITISTKTLTLPEKDPGHYAAHELAHALWSDPAGAQTMEDNACEDLRVNLWLRDVCGIIVGERSDYAIIEKLLQRRQYQTALLCEIALAHLPLDTNALAERWPIMAGRVYTLLSMCRELMSPEDGIPAPECRRKQLADALRETMEEFFRAPGNGGAEAEIAPDDTGGPLIPNNVMAIFDILKPVRELRTHRCADTGAMPLRFDRLVTDGNIFAVQNRRAAIVAISAIDVSVIHPEGIPTPKLIEIIKRYAAKYPNGIVTYFCSDRPTWRVAIAYQNRKMADPASIAKNRCPMLGLDDRAIHSMDIQWPQFRTRLYVNPRSDMLSRLPSSWRVESV